MHNSCTSQVPSYRNASSEQHSVNTKSALERTVPFMHDVYDEYTGIVQCAHYCDSSRRGHSSDRSQPTPPGPMVMLYVHSESKVDAIN